MLQYEYLSKIQAIWHRSSPGPAIALKRSLRVVKNSPTRGSLTLHFGLKHPMTGARFDLGLNEITREKNPMSLSLRNPLTFALAVIFCTAARGEGATDAYHPPAILPLESETAPETHCRATACRAPCPRSRHYPVPHGAREDHAGIW